MKKNCSLLILCLFYTAAQSQTFPYYFSTTEGVYTPLVNGTSVNNGQVWDDPEILAPLGFDFTFWGTTIDQVYMLPDFAINAFGVPPPAQSSPLIISYGADLVDRGFDDDNSLSPISFLTEGVVGSRIFKLEFSNAGFYNDDNDNDFVNTQLWLYEGSNDIEIHFGPSQTSSVGEDLYDGYSGPIIGFIKKYNYSGFMFDELWYLYGPPANPELKYITYDNADTLQYTLFNSPANGRIYRFSTTQVGATLPASADQLVQVSPTLVQDICLVKIASELSAQDLQYQVLDQLGKPVSAGNLNNQIETINTARFGPGMYYVHVSNKGATVAVKKIIKQ